MPENSTGVDKLTVSPYLLDFIAVVILFGAWFTESIALQSSACLIAALLSVCAALSSKRLRQYILDTPQSKIASAAQGFVELRGKARFYADNTTQGFTHGPPCVWHRFTIFELMCLPVRTGESELPFIISDDSGDCVVNASGAKILSSSRRGWFQGGRYYKTKFIRHGAEVYVIGELRTNGCEKSYYSEKTELNSVLRTWKQDPAWLLEEFDSDNNGELSFEEWEAARKRAERIAQDKYKIKREDHVETAIRKPSNGMPMLISDKSPAILARNFSYLGYFNLLVAAFCIVVFFLNFHGPG